MTRTEDEDEALSVPKSFPRTSSPSNGKRNKAAEFQKVAEDGVHKMHRFTLYETVARFYLVGGDIEDRKYRILWYRYTGHLGCD